MENYLKKNLLEHADEDGNYVPPFDFTGDEFDLEEYNNGTDGVGPLLVNVLEDVGFKGNVDQFFSNVLGIMTEYVESHVADIGADREIIINVPLNFPNSSLYAVAICNMDGKELHRFDAIPECEITINGEEFNVSKEIEDVFADRYVNHPDNRRFVSDYEKSKLEVAKRIHRK